MRSSSRQGGRIVAGQPGVIIPRADSADVLAGREGQAGRNAQRRVRVRAIEDHAAFSQPIEVWRVDDLVSRTPHDLGSVLVGHDAENVRSVVAVHVFLQSDTSHMKDSPRLAWTFPTILSPPGKVDKLLPRHSKGAYARG